MAENTKTSAQMGRENRKKIIAELKKAFSLDNEILKFLNKSPTQAIEDLLAGTFKNKNTKTKTSKIVKEVITKSKKPTNEKSKKPTSTATPFTIKPKTKTKQKQMTQKEAAQKRKRLLQTGKKTPTVSLTIASIGIPKSRPKPDSKGKESPIKKTQKNDLRTMLVTLKSGKKGTIKQRLAEIDREKALEKVKKLASASLKKKKKNKGKA